MKEEVQAHEVACDECGEVVGVFAIGVRTPSCLGCGKDLCMYHAYELIINKDTPFESRTVLCQEHFTILLQDLGRLLNVHFAGDANVVEVNIRSQAKIKKEHLIDVDRTAPTQ